MAEENNNHGFLKYEYSVLDVCRTLHGWVKGTSIDFGKEEFQRRLNWLKWRVKEGWDDEEKTISVRHSVYDVGVHVLALATICLCEEL